MLAGITRTHAHSMELVPSSFNCLLYHSEVSDCFSIVRALCNANRLLQLTDNLTVKSL